MKNHIAVKFIAIVLCAAALLGIAACGTGVTVLTGLGLYDKTPTQLHDGWLNDRGMWLGHDVAQRYASEALGNCPEDLLEQNYFVHQRFRPGTYRYELKDAEGNILVSNGNPDVAGEVKTFPVTGKYLYLVSAEPLSDMEPIDSEETIIPCEQISLSVSGIQLTHAGEEYPLVVGAVDSDTDAAIVTLFPEDTTDEVAYASENEAVVTVDETGLISAVGPGITMIHITCGPHDIVFPVSCQFVEETTTPTQEIETVPATEATEPFVYDAWDDETWDRIKRWIQEEWNKDTWENDKWDDLEDWARENWKEDEWNDAQWAQLRHWIQTEWDKEEPVEITEATIPETEPTVPATEPKVEETKPLLDLKEIEAESLRKEAERETIPEEILVNGRPITDYEIYHNHYYDTQLDEQVRAQCVMLDMPEYTLELYLAPGAFAEELLMPLLEFLHSCRQMMLPMLFAFLLLFAMLGVYLCCAAGRKPKSDEIRASGMNRLPLELYTGLVILAVVGVVGAVNLAAEQLLEMNLAVACAVVAGFAYLACLVIVGFLFALAAQLKTPGRFWLKNSLCGHCWRIFMWFWHKFLGLIPALLNLAKKLWTLVLRILSWCWNLVQRCLAFIWQKLSVFGKLYGLLPLVWQWLLTGASLLLLPVFALALDSEVLLTLAIIADIVIILYGVLAFGTLLDGTKRMSKGDLNTRIDDHLLFGCFKDFAQNLNALANVAIVAAQKQLKSERMKTELITNVSHDIKTPLTSIINYVDLLQKAETQQEREQYLEVLSRQSQQLKKLIEDLIEMSKASTGNMNVDLALMDAVEAVTQALGEFSDKLDKAQLTPVFRHSEEMAPMMADGKLVWRVLHNLLSNAVKYALPGTRLYIDLMQVEGKVIISMKNVSREELNVEADELMERFVRGDDSRNTEGSGLGLNIAKSMMELQHGQLELLVDGDLFKVTLIFPGV